MVELIRTETHRQSSAQVRQPLSTSADVPPDSGVTRAAVYRHKEPCVIAALDREARGGDQGGRFGDSGLRLSSSGRRSFASPRTPHQSQARAAGDARRKPCVSPLQAIPGND